MQMHYLHFDRGPLDDRVSAQFLGRYLARLDNLPSTSFNPILRVRAVSHHLDDLTQCMGLSGPLRGCDFPRFLERWVEPNLALRRRAVK